MAVKNVQTKKILITGGAGFIGANFVHAFADMGYSVTVLEREGTNLWRLGKIKNNVNIQYVDLLDYPTLEGFITKLNPNIILHFATYGAYQARQQEVKTTVDTNLLGTINLVNACSKISFDCFINTGSSSEYGVKIRAMKETDTLEPNNLYGVTKAASTMYCQHIAKKFNLPIITIRPFTPYGYFEDKDRLVPTIIRACLNNTELKLSAPGSVRDFVFIEDAIALYVNAIKYAQKSKGQVFNLGSGKQQSVAQMVALVKKITNSPVKPLYGQVKKVWIEPGVWKADISKTKKLLRWKPAHTLQQGLIKNMQWFKENESLYI